ncbi:MAG: T9SS C-terminal target domain-containing protein [Calditrichaeota bacterium]|nr:MAG: T9SS C-terminal target domain-containing protein [Calditrichota bacterium]
MLKFPANVTYRLPDVPLPNPVPLAIISGFWSDNGGSASIAFNLSGQSVLAVPAPDILVYPNPLRPEDQVQQIAFLNLPPGARIDILTASGKHLRQLAPGDGENQTFWDLRTSQGNLVGSGVYLYHIRWPGGEKNGKMMVIR